MNTATIFKFSLDTSSKKITCPGCNQKKAVRYKNNGTGEFLPDKVCRCDRESSCGYHYTPKQYLTDIGQGYTPVTRSTTQTEVKPEVVDYMPEWYITRSMQAYSESNFAAWVITLFGREIASKALLQYFVGRSKLQDGKYCIFWRIDKEGKVRTGKIMQYNPLTGKRVKTSPPTWVHFNTNMQPFNFKLCFFGEYLISKHPDKTIGIVESEKTAIIASIFMPDMVWLATGGNSGCKWREWSVFHVLKNRNIILFPDYGYYNRKTLKTCFDEWSDRANTIMSKMNCKIKVSRILEERFKETERLDQDLADVLINQENGTGVALTDDNYPAAFDLYKMSNEELSDLIKQYGNN